MKARNDGAQTAVHSHSRRHRGGHPPDGSLDLADATLAQMDIVVASVHSHFNQPGEEMTARVLRGAGESACADSGASDRAQGAEP